MVHRNLGTEGVEPPRVTPQDPKSCAYASFATCPKLNKLLWECLGLPGFAWAAP